MRTTPESLALAAMRLQHTHDGVAGGPYLSARIIGKWRAQATRKPLAKGPPIQQQCALVPERIPPLRIGLPSGRWCLLRRADSYVPGLQASLQCSHSGSIRSTMACQSAGEPERVKRRSQLVRSALRVG